MGNRSTKPSKALYRLHRSHDFNEVVGQDHVVKTLQSAIKQGRLAHAYLFTGPRGVGKTSVARILAHAANGLNYKDERLQLDIIEIDAASNRGIDEIRELREKVHIAPSTAKYKVYIIDEVHMLTTPAFNALLKTLEEPPQHAIFVLATTEPHKVPETIISRTQRFSFKPIDQEVITQRLLAIADLEEIALQEEAAKLIATHAGGGLRDAISMLDQLHGQGNEIDLESVRGLLGLAPAEQLDEIIALINKQQLNALLELLEHLFSGGASPTALAMQIVDALRNRVRQGETKHYHLVEELLDVGMSREPQLKLEAILARACLEGVAKADEEARQREKVRTKQTTSKKVESETSRGERNAKSEIKKTSHSTPLDSRITLPPSKWQQILTEVKSHNNSLYAVLRLAQPAHEADNLKLFFAFDFHANRANESRNKELLEQVAGSILGQEVTVHVTIDKKLQSEKDRSDPITSVIGVMGGGSVVEYSDE